ncbi:LacI family DNA-binding transcriptional regulator [Paenibacillus oceani]|uniref:LacI family DNA-binding transcriptional regulator n=1 Tax=Paenibacillus oceani TaxID=2772510 RepID=A0A927C957_9BACL|nr:LacI family DNA-binding transcriptional regulator [Paenibacillus oceani]MBD2862312.1 LacI family DNA-binding transcriptional regulator [Paenibacillus oceani]
MSSVKDVAKLAEVSVATVSRVLNQDPTVKTKNRLKVLKAIDELHFSPNILAKNLRKKSSSTIVIVMSSISNPFFADIVKGAQEAIRDSNGYNMIIGTTEWQADTYRNMLRTNQVDGILVISSWANEQTIQDLNAHYPVVMCNEYYENMNLSYVAIDNRKASYDAACELLQRGCKHIVYVAGAKDSSSVKDRLGGFKQALADAGVTFQPHFFVQPKKGREEIGTLLNDMVDRGIPIDGLLTHSDLYAAHILKGMEDRTIHLDRKTGLISFAGTFVTQITSPRISSIVQPAYELGFTSVQLLLRKIKNKEIHKSKQVILNHQLVIRET